MRTSRPLAVPLLLLLLLPACGGCRKETRLSTASPEALRAYHQGVLQYDRFYYNDSKSLLEQAIRTDSAFAMAWARLAIVELAIRDEPLAKQYIERASELSGGTTEREQLKDIAASEQRIACVVIAVKPMSSAMLRAFHGSPTQKPSILPTFMFATICGGGMVMSEMSAPAPAASPG